jgi:hypothetical protein
MSATTSCNSCCVTPELVSLPGTDGQSAFTTTAAPFVVPAKGAAVNGVVFVNTDWMAIGMSIYIVGGGYFTVTNIPSSTTANLTYQDISANTNAGATVLLGAKVASGGTGGDSINAFTVVTLANATPAVGTAIVPPLSVEHSDWMAVGQYVFVEGSGIYTVVSTPTDVSANLTYMNVVENTNAGNPIALGALVTPSGAGTVNNINGVGSPVGVITPVVVNQFYRDTAANSLWQATGLTNTDWFQWI